MCLYRAKMNTGKRNQNQKLQKIFSVSSSILHSSLCI